MTAYTEPNPNPRHPSYGFRYIHDTYWDQLEGAYVTASEQGAALANGERQSDYGHPSKNFTVIADLWNAYLGTSMSPEDAACLMILLKVARVKTGGSPEDSIRDIAGYAEVLRLLGEPVPASRRAPDPSGSPSY